MRFEEKHPEVHRSYLHDRLRVCTVIKSSSSAAGEAGLNSPSEWSEDTLRFLFFAPTRVIVLQESWWERTETRTE